MPILATKIFRKIRISYYYLFSLLLFVSSFWYLMILPPDENSYYNNTKIRKLAVLLLLFIDGRVNISCPKWQFMSLVAKIIRNIRFCVQICIDIARQIYIKNQNLSEISKAYNASQDPSGRKRASKISFSYVKELLTK